MAVMSSVARSDPALTHPASSVNAWRTVSFLIFRSRLNVIPDWMSQLAARAYAVIDGWTCGKQIFPTQGPVADKRYNVKLNNTTTPGDCGFLATVTAGQSVVLNW
jgi:hypothetical protein